MPKNKIRKKPKKTKICLCYIWSWGSFAKSMYSRWWPVLQEMLIYIQFILHELNQIPSQNVPFPEICDWWHQCCLLCSQHIKGQRKHIGFGSVHCKYQNNKLLYTDFYNLKEFCVCYCKNMKKEKNGEKVNWLKVKWIRVTKSNLKSIHCKLWIWRKQIYWNISFR
jgi:hypothetical protein